MAQQSDAEIIRVSFKRLVFILPVLRVTGIRDSAVNPDYSLLTDRSLTIFTKTS
jgi:hypothetical protein